MKRNIKHHDKKRILKKSRSNASKVSKRAVSTSLQHIHLKSHTRSQSTFSSSTPSFQRGISSNHRQNSKDSSQSIATRRSLQSPMTTSARFSSTQSDIPVVHRKLYTERPTRIAVVGAGVSGLSFARMAKSLGLDHNITLFDRHPIGGASILNNKRNHAVTLTSTALDTIQTLDPKLFRRLLSLGRFDTYSGIMGMNDIPTHPLLPKLTDAPFPRWVNHLALPRDAYISALLTSPFSNQKGDARVGINVANITQVIPPVRDSSKALLHEVPVVKLVPEGLKSDHNVRDLMYNLVVASDGATSDIWASQFGRDKTTRLRPSPNNDVRIIGWAPVSCLESLVGHSVNGQRISSLDDAFKRVSTRVWTRRDAGVRMTTFLMEYAPHHLHKDSTQYAPKEPTEKPEWIYWEAVVANSVWTKTKLPIPSTPATNNVYNSPDAIDALKSAKDNPNAPITKGVFMGADDPIKPLEILNISPLAKHPVLAAIISATPENGITVEASMSNPISALHTSFFHSNIIYTGSAAGLTLNDTFMQDTANIDQANALALAAAAYSTAPPELGPHRIGALVNKVYLERWRTIHENTNGDSQFYGESSRLMNSLSKFSERYFPVQVKQDRYERLYRFNVQKEFALASNLTSLDILKQNQEVKDSLQRGFMDGKTKPVDFGDIPINNISLKKM